MHPDVVIVGAGMAGCAVAERLSAHCQVTILEAGPEIAAEGAAQSAGMVRRLDPDPIDRALAQQTYSHLTDAAPPELSEKTGAILAMVRDPLSLHDAVAHLRDRGIPVSPIEPSEVHALRESPVHAAWHLPDERVTDGPRLAQHLLDMARRRGAKVHTGTPVERLIIEQGRCVGVATRTEHYLAEHTILAAGAWSAQLVQPLGIERPLIPLRRAAAHIKASRPAPDRAWIWLDDVGLYAKPDGEGWVVSPCDEHPDRPVLAQSSTTDPSPAQWQLLSDKIARYLPYLAQARAVRGWTGLRTFCPDRRPILGPDEACPGLVWAAGLGGHGVSGCVGVGEAISAWLLGRPTPWLDPSSVAPTRPQLQRWPIYPDGDPGRAKLIGVTQSR